MGLFEKFVVVVKEELGHYGMTDFTGMDDQELIALNLNLKHKLIRQERFVVKESPEVIAKGNALGTQYKTAYAEIRQKLTNGDDVNPFLSKQAKNPKYHDCLLLDWDIHHFHLNCNNSGGYFNDRSDYLLMVLLKDGIAYFVDIEHHSDNEVFVKREYLEIIHNNWPDAIERFALKEVLDVAVHYTNDDIKKLRKANINAILKIGNKVYAPIGGGMTSAGTGSMHMVRAIRWKKSIDSIEERYIANKAAILAAISTQLGRLIEELDLDFDYLDGQLFLVEKNSGMALEKMAV